MDDLFIMVVLGSGQVGDQGVAIARFTVCAFTVCASYLVSGLSLNRLTSSPSSHALLSNWIHNICAVIMLPSILGQSYVQYA